MRLLPADDIDFSALLFSAGLFIVHFAVDKCRQMCYNKSVERPHISQFVCCVRT